MNDYSAQFQSTYYCTGLRNYLVKVYNYMAMALGITGVVSLVTSMSPGLMSVLYGTPLHWVVAIAPVVMVFFMSARIGYMSMRSVMLVFFGFSALMGLSLSYIFMVYTAHSIARAFFISSTMFGLTAWYGNTTKKDLSKFSTFLFMGVVGLIIASVVNIFMMSSPLYFAISFVSVIVFTGMTALDAQRIKDMYYRFNDGSELTSGKAAVMGATSLYFNYINLFLGLLHLIGDRK